MDEAPLRGLLDVETDSEVAGRALGAVVRRHRHRRAARLRFTGVTMAVVIGGTAVGLGVSQLSTGSGQESATAVGRGKAPGLQIVPSAELPSGTSGPDAGPIEPSIPSTATTLRAGSKALCAMYGCGPGKAIERIDPVTSRSANGLKAAAYAVTLARGPAMAPGFHPNQTAQGSTASSLPATPLAVPACERSSELVVRIWSLADSHRSVEADVVVARSVGIRRPLRALAEQVVDGAGEPTAVLAVAQVGRSVSAVVARFGDGEVSRVKAVGGWAVFLERAASQTRPSWSVSFEALSARGRVLERARLPHPGTQAVNTSACGRSG